MIKEKIIKIHRSIYVPQNDVEEVERLTRSKKGMNFNKAANEGLQLWLKQNRKKETGK